MKTQLFKTRRPNLFKLPILVFALALFTFSCSNEDAEVIQIEAEGPSIIEVLASYNQAGAVSKGSNSKSSDYEPTFEILSVALAKNKLTSTVSRNRWTVFAPTDKAFEAIGLNKKNVANFPGIIEILTYHVIGAQVYSSDLALGTQAVGTIQGTDVIVTAGEDGSVLVNNSNVVIADLRARNGVIHAIDSVLSIPSLNLVELASSFTDSPNFSILIAAAIRANLAGALLDVSPETVFAPTNMAFKTFLAAGSDEEAINTINSLAPEAVASILTYHLIDGYVFSNQLSNGYVPTLNGAAVNVSLDMGPMINDANVVVANVQATNGVIHVIDKVLSPPTMNLVDLASSFAPEFSVLLAAATKAGLAGVLMGDGTYEQLTVFAPTNQAFLNLLDSLDGYSSLDDFDTEEDIALLTSILLYHVAEGRIYSSDLSNEPVGTLGGSFDLSGLSITTSSMGTANLVPSLLDIQATNGVIHVVDAVLVP
ncbi:fasciclin domain-containing protein [uncultured Algibacter sp.]|uniref:fasciclin domain-containing protein n=1 Tax=uncultured Algibacter sp. TaxID=298659 RepID=UPI002602D506|nr:fasciclin domain-containing protein [uncultured Algibacter sp.]